MSCEGGKQGKISLLSFVTALIHMKKGSEQQCLGFPPSVG